MVVTGAGDIQIDVLVAKLKSRFKKVLRHGAAEHFLGKDHLFGIGVRLKADPHVADLAGAAGLLLMTALLLTAAQLAYKAALPEASPVLLEPIGELKTVLFSLMGQYTPWGRADQFPEINRKLRRGELRAQNPV